MISLKELIYYLIREFTSPFLLGSYYTWLKELWFNTGYEKAFLPRIFIISTLRFATIPIRLMDKLLLNPLARKPKIEKSPIFIIGHWRSGTTYLHNLLSQDPQYAFLSLLGAIAPEMMLSHNFLKKIFFSEPQKRPMDNLMIAPDFPQEDEFALANISEASYYHAWMFPKNAAYYFNKYAVMEDISAAELAEWERTYLQLTQKLSMLSGGRRLISKNPVNSGRISKILHVFPDAKFIYLVRDPYEVFPSSYHLYHKMYELSQLQTVSDNDIKENVFAFYKKLVKKYLSEKNLISEGNLVEIRFEDLESNPLRQLEHIYTVLSVPEFEKALPFFKTYIQSQAGYQKNRFANDPDICQEINTHWGFAIDHWGYKQHRKSEGIKKG